MRQRGAMGSATVTRILLAIGLLLGVVVTTANATASAGSMSVPSFVKQFQPDTIGPGSTSTLTFTIDNDTPETVTDLAFSDTLPAAVTIAGAPAVTDTCDATVSAPAGGTTITVSDGGVGAFSSCQISVNTTSATTGTHSNLSGDLTSSKGNSGAAADDLTVSESLPGFSKTFSPSSVPFGGRSTLTFVIDNSANDATEDSLDFTDELPAGMTVAGPSNAATTCAPAFGFTTLTAAPGSSTIDFFAAGFPALEAGGSCTVTVDVVGGAVGMLQNVSDNLLVDGPGLSLVEAGRAAATLEVTSLGGLLELVKEFTDDPVPPGGTVTLEFTVFNRSRDDSATGIGFTDDLDATLSGLAPSAPLPTDPCGLGSTLTFALGELTLTSGSLPAEGSCTFAVTLAVPATAANGTFPNSAGPVSGDVGGSPETGNVAGDLLFVTSFPVLTKEFTDDPVGSGDTVTLEFTITNPEDDSAMSGISFEDVFDEVIKTASTIPGAGFCGPGSTATFTPFFDGVSFNTPASLAITGASLPASGSCTFSVVLDVVDGASSGIYPNTTGEITGTLDDFAGPPTVSGPGASDDLVVVGAPMLIKEFTDDPVVPGGSATLQFTIENHDLDNAASAIAFTDDLTATLAGLTATSVDFNDCGATVDITTDPTLIDVSGGSLAADSSCTITLTLGVPSGGAAAGQHVNDTSTITATVAGVATVGPAATDTLVVSGLSLSKEFDPATVVAGRSVTLTFVLANTGTENTADVSFSDDLTAILPGSPDFTTPDFSGPGCGGGTLSSTSNVISLSGDSFAAGAGCTITIDVLAPAGAADGTYANVTSALSATIDGSPVTLPPAAAPITVDSEIIALSKQFTDDPAVPGGTVTLEFGITNTSPDETVADLAFTDDLSAVLAGLEASSVDVNDCPSAVVDITTPSMIDVSGGSLAPGASCTIRLTLDLPPGPVAGNLFPNTTSTPTGTVGVAPDDAPVTGNQASDTLRVDTVTFTKSFDGPTTATGTAELTFTITNLNAATGIDPISFSDNLGNVLPGLFASGLPAAPCGAGSTLAGSSFLTLTGGNLPPGGSCTFSVTVNVPAGTGAGDYDNLTSALKSAGVTIADPATATLTIEPPPTFAKAFAPNPIVAGGVSTLTFTIDNSASGLAAQNLDFTDNLPAGVVIATPSNASTTCTGGILTAPNGGTTIAYTGGTVNAASDCTVDVDVTSDVAGDHDNVSGDLTSTSGTSNAAADTLTVTPAPPPLFAKEFAPDAITEGDVSTLTFTIDNTAALIPATDLDFTDTLPADVVIATPSNASTTCTGGTLTAPDGGTTIAYTGGTVAKSATCTVSVGVTSDVAGAHDNVSGDLTSSSGNSGSATDTLNVGAIPPLFSKQFAPDSITEGDDSTLTFTIDNSASANTATSLDFTDVLPAGVVVADPVVKSKTCTGGMVGATGGGDTISYAGGEVAAGATCTVNVDVTGASVGVKDNVSGDLTSSSGNSGTAADTLTVAAIPPSFTKVFDPDMISEGDSSTLTFTIDNSASTGTASDLDFTDVLPPDVVIDTPSDATTDCTGGTLTAPDGGTTISYTGGEVGPGAVCTVSVDVTSDVVGDHVNVSNALTSTSGNSGAATDTLTVVETQPFTTVIGRRYADTRLGGFTFDGLFQGAGPRPAGSTYEVVIAGRGTVPVDAVGAIINVTSVGSSPPPGYFTVFDCDGLPTASALNYVSGVDVANEIFAKLSDDGSVCVFTFSQSEILIDVVGFVQADDTVKLLDAARLAESREGAPTADGIMAGFGRTTAGSTTTVQVTGRGGVPTNVKAVIVNVAAVDPDDTSFLSVFPCTPGLTPTTSTINYTTGVNRANEVIAEVNAAGEICIYTDTDIDLIVDVYGYVEPTSTLTMFGPERFADTRGGPTLDGLSSGGGPLAAGSTYEVQITGRDSVPAGAAVVVANVVAVDPLEDGFFTVTGCVTPTPNASSLNYIPGVNGANELVVELSADGKICIFTSGATDVIVDVVGYVPDPVT